MVLLNCAVCGKTIRGGQPVRFCAATNGLAPEDQGKVGDMGSAHTACYNQLVKRRAAWREQQVAAQENRLQTRAAAAAQSALPERRAAKPNASEAEQLQQAGQAAGGCRCTPRLAGTGSAAGQRLPLLLGLLPIWELAPC